MAEKETNTPEIDRLSDALASIFTDLLVEETGKPVDDQTSSEIACSVKSGVQDYIAELKIE